MKSVLKYCSAILFGAMCHLPAGAATVNLGTVSPPYTTNYGNSFQSAIGAFTDDFTFTLSPAGTVQTFAASIDLANVFQITGLQARLFQGSAPYVPGVTPPLLQAWSSPISFAPGVSGSQVVIAPIDLAANTYTLELRGNVVGGAGGSYSGVLNVAAIPEPGTYTMMLVGLCLLTTAARRASRSR